ncbi:MAG TPA: hypothetical protein PKC28_11570 [Bdellovibrionales bacterium]|nr:hypothetical protein [Bdellovibrionales bacterium]
MTKGVLSLLISVSLIAPPQAFARGQTLPRPNVETRPGVSLHTTLQANLAVQDKMVGKKLPASRGVLRQQARSALSKGLQFERETLNLGTTMIVLGALLLKGAADRAEMTRLSGGKLGQIPPYDPKLPICGQAAGASPTQDLLCAGDFMIGLVTPAFLAGASVAVISLLKKAPFVKLITGMVSNSLVFALGISSGMIWSEAVKYLKDVKDTERAHGLAGRALIASISNNWEAFAASEDGRLFRDICSIIWDIVASSPDRRSIWMANLWRYGGMRGETWAMIGTIVGTSAAGPVVVGALATGVGGIAGAGIAYGTPVILAALSFGTVYALLNSNIPQNMTEALQNARRGMASLRLRTNLNYMRMIADEFNVDRGGRDDSYAEYLRGEIQSTLNERALYRDRWVNVTLEKYYELKIAVEIMEQHILAARTVVKNSGLSKHIYLNVDGEILSYAEVMKRKCVNESSYKRATRGPWRPTCGEPPEAEQLKILDELTVKAKEARATLYEMAFAIPELYERDYKDIDGLLDFNTTRNWLPVGIVNDLGQFQRRTWMLQRDFVNKFSVLDARFAGEWEGLALPSDPDMKTQIEMQVRGIFDHYFGLWYQEDILYPSLELQAEIEKSL